ncbi:MAG: TIM barrel protein [Bacteroidota bacterium]
MALPFLELACSKKATEQSAAEPFPLGMQLYSIASLLSQDFQGTIKTLAKAGYKKLEFAGPYYFSSQEERDNNVLLKFFGLKGSGYYDLKPNELKTFLDDLGLSAPSAHVSLQSLDENIEEVLNAAQIVGHQYIVCPMMVISTIEEYKTMADKFNVIGEACAKAGIRFGYHNHSLEFGARSGEIPMDVLLKRTDESLVSFELDIFWTTVAGVDAVKYMTDYPGRFHLMHLKDMKSRMEKPDTDWETFTDTKRGQAISRMRQT